MSDVVDVEADLARVESLLEINRAADALTLVTRVIGNAPDNTKAWCFAARCHSILGDHWEMLRAADQAIRCGPRNEWGYRLRSMALRYLNYRVESIAAARTSVSLAPLAWQSHVNLVEALLTLPDRDLRRQAYASAKTAVRLGPEATSTHLALGRVYASIGETKRAHDCYARALALDPTDAIARTNMAALALRQGRIAAAGAGFRSVAGTNPDNKAYVDNVGVAANHWLVRICDIGAFVLFVVLMVSAVPPEAIRTPTVLALTGAYLLGTVVTFARLPRAMRVLVRQHARAGRNLASLVLLAFALTVVTLTGALAPPTAMSVSDPTSLSVFVTILVALRFRRRIQRWIQPYLLRRRYSAYVVGDDERKS